MRAIGFRLAVFSWLTLCAQTAGTGCAPMWVAVGAAGLGARFCFFVTGDYTKWITQ